MKHLPFLLAASFLLNASFSLIHAQSASWNIGAKFGILFPGEIYVEPPEEYYGTEMGVTGSLNVDAVIAPKFSMGLFYQFAAATDSYYEEEFGLGTFGLTLKSRFPLTNKLFIRPGVVLGYQLSHHWRTDEASGLDIGALAEIAYPIKQGHAIVAELGFLTQPVGGNDEFDILFGPLFYLTMGYEVGR